MMKTRKTDHRKTKGFTLMEVVLVIAIVSILAMVAIPSVFQIQRSLKSTEMQAASRQIYIAAQNRLTMMKSAGTLSTILPSQPGEDSFSWISGEHMPADYDSEANPLENYENKDEILCYAINKNNDGNPTAGKFITDILIPVGAVDNALLQGHYTIEYNPHEGAVYGVFYADEFFSYAEVRDTDRLSSSLRNIEGQPIVGYYGGIGIHTPSIGAPDSTESGFIIVNDESLLIKIQADTSKKYIVTIEDKGNPAGFAQYTYVIHGNENDFSQYLGGNVFKDEGGNITILLDSLQAGKHFSELFIVPNTAIGQVPIAPGRDIRISLSAEDISASGPAIPSVTTKTTNSLFSFRSENEASLTCGRHLQNLEPTVSSVSDITSAVVKNEINWATAEVASFKAISNSELKSFVGGGNLLSNFSITSNGTYCGLFGTFGGNASARATLLGVRLSDVTINGGTANYIGALAGSIAYTDISNCSTFALNPQDSANGQLTATAATGAGGLVGTSSNNKYEYCFASLQKMNVKATSNLGAGGFIGISDTDAISHCYANTTEINVTPSGTAGGFAGRASNSNASYSYAVGNINQTGGTAATGFWYASGGSANNCYAATTFEDKDTLSYGFSNGNGSITNCSYFSGAKPTHTTPITGITGRDLAGLSATYSGNYWRKPTAASTHRYRMDLTPPIYPVSLVRTLVHYGNWPVVATSTLVPIGDTDILGPDVVIPAGQVMVFKEGQDEQYVFLSADLLKAPFSGEAHGIQGGSLYVPASIGTLQLDTSGHNTINWDVSGHIIMETDIAINNNNVTVTMLSRNGDILLNGADMTKGGANPYIVNITATNGEIKANGAHIETKPAGNGKINLVAKNSINISEAHLISAGDYGINVQSTTGNITASGATIKTTGQGHLKLESGGLIDLDQATITSVIDLTIKSAGNISAQSANITNSAYGKTIDINSSNGTIDLSSLLPPERQTVVSSSGGNVYITAKEDIFIQSAKIAASTEWGMELKFKSTGSGRTLWVENATVQGKSITAENLLIDGVLASGTI